MAIKDSPSLAAGSDLLLGIVRMPIEAGVALQKELLDAYEKAGHAWLPRVKAEFELWTELAAKVVAPRSLLEAVDAYGESMARRMQMSVEDGQHLLHDYQEITKRIIQAVSKRQLSGTT
jgi:hypothetical protein